MPDSATQRAHAAFALRQIVFGGHTFDWVLHQHPSWLQHPASRAWVLDTLRYFFSAKISLDARLQSPLRARDSDLYCLMLVGTYQLYNGQPDYAVVNESVNACKILRKPWAKKLVNGVLRGIVRDLPNDRSVEPKEARTQSLEGRHTEHNAYLTAQLRQDHELVFGTLVSAHLLRPPMTLRVNHQRISTQDYVAQLRRHDIAVEPIDAIDTAVHLSQPQPTSSLPGFAQGQVAVQDLGAQYAIQLLQEHVTATTHVLDACAAPGGKLFHLIEQFPHLEPQVLEISQRRAQDMASIALRLGHDIQVQCEDATETHWWDGRPFDLILLDAPCSGSGTIRRHPEIKLQLDAQDVATHRATQLNLLHNLWPMLAPDGVLLYCTCSLLSSENDGVIGQFIDECGAQQQPSPANRYPGMPTPLSIHLDRGQPTQFGWQLLPTDPLTDGFYYAPVRKRA